MRIRQIKPSYWTDGRLARLAPASREFYVGLWMLADDAGWLTWDTEEVATQLYPYQTPGRRTRAVERMAAELEAQGRVIRHACGHALVPTLPEHQRISAAKRVVTVWTAHQRCRPAAPPESPRRPAAPPESPRLPAPVRKGKVGKGKVGAQARDHDDEPATPFVEAMAAAGIDARIVGR